MRKYRIGEGDSGKEPYFRSQMPLDSNGRAVKSMHLRMHKQMNPSFNSYRLMSESGGAGMRYFTTSTVSPSTSMVIA